MSVFIQRVRLFLLLSFVMSSACGEAYVGEVGPGGSANRFLVEDSTGALDFLAVRTAAVRTSTAVVRLVAEGDRGASPAPSPLTLDLELNLARLDEGPLPLDFDIAQTTRFSLVSTSSLAWQSAPDSAPPFTLRAVRLLDSPLNGSGQQRFDGRLRIIFLDRVRMEAFVRLDFEGSTPAEPSFERSYRLEAFFDVLRP